MQKKVVQNKKTTLSVSADNSRIFSIFKHLYNKIRIRVDNKKVAKHNLKNDFLVVSLKDNCVFLNNEKLIDKNLYCSRRF